MGGRRITSDVCAIEGCDLPRHLVSPKRNQYSRYCHEHHKVATNEYMAERRKRKKDLNQTKRKPKRKPRFYHRYRYRPVRQVEAVIVVPRKGEIVIARIRDRRLDRRASYEVGLDQLGEFIEQLRRDGQRPIFISD